MRRTRRMSKSRRMKGGNFKDNISSTNLASTAASFTGPTAEPHTWVGGKSRRRSTSKKSRSRKSRRH